MKISIYLLGLISATLANEVDNSIDIKSITLCATFNNVYRTFANIWEVYNEFKATGQLWIPVATGACAVTPIDCTVLRPVCAVTSNKFFKTFPNQCVLEAEQNATGTVWTIVFNGICSTNPADGFLNSNSVASAQQSSNNDQNRRYGVSVPVVPQRVPLSSSLQQPPLPNDSSPPSTVFNPVKEQITSAVPSLIPINYRQSSVQAETNRGLLPSYASPAHDIAQLPITRYSNSGQEQKLSQSNPAPSPAPASYDQGSLQFHPPQAKLSSPLKLTGYRSSVNEPKPITAYGDPSPVFVNYAQASSDVGGEQASIALYAPEHRLYGSVKEPQLVPKYAAAINVPANDNQDPPQPQPQQTLVPSYVSPSQVIRYQNSPPQSQPTPSSPVSSPSQAKYNQGPLQYQRKPSSSSSYGSIPQVPVYHNSALESQASPKYSSPSSGPASSVQSFTQPQPSKNSLPSNASPAQETGYRSSVQVPQRSPTYSALPSNTDNYDRNSPQSQPPQALLTPHDSTANSPACNNSVQSKYSIPSYSAPSPHSLPPKYTSASKDYNPTQEQQLSSKYAVASPGKNNNYQSVSQVKLQQAAVYSNSIQKSRPSSSYSAPSDQENYIQDVLHSQQQPASSSNNSGYQNSVQGQQPSSIDSVQPAPVYNDQPLSQQQASSSSTAENYNRNSPQHQPMEEKSSTCASNSPGLSPAPDSADEPLLAPAYNGLQSQSEKDQLPLFVSLLYNVASSSSSRKYNSGLETNYSPSFPLVFNNQANAQKQPDQGPLPSHESHLQYAATSSSAGVENSFQEAQPEPKYSAPPYYDRAYQQDKTVQNSSLNVVPKIYITSQTPQPQTKQAESPSCASSSFVSLIASNSDEEPPSITSNNAQLLPQYQSKQLRLPHSYNDGILQVSGLSVQKPQTPARNTASASLSAYNSEASGQNQSEQPRLQSNTYLSYDSSSLIPQPSAAHDAPMLGIATEQEESQSCGLSSISSSSASNSDNSPPFSAAPSPITTAEYYNSSQEPQPSPAYPESFLIPQDQPQQVPLPSYTSPSADGKYNNNQQSVSESAPCNNNVENENQIFPSQSTSVTSDTSNNILNQDKNDSYSDKSQAYIDGASSNQNNQDDTPTIYNGVVYQGPYYYEPKYKHVNYGNFNFLPAQSSIIGKVPSPNADSSVSSHETEDQDCSTNPFEQLLKQLQYIASKSDKSSY